MSMHSPLGGALGFSPSGGATRPSAAVGSPISLSTVASIPVGFTVPAPGIVEFALWGAGGAAYSSYTGCRGGSGGFAGGKIALNAGDVVRFGAGQGGYWCGTVGTPAGGIGAGGLGNGGNGGGESNIGWGGSGGGASILWLNGWIIAVAGGGAGGRNVTGNAAYPGGGPGYGGLASMDGGAGAGGSMGGGGGGGGYTGGAGGGAGGSGALAFGGSGYLANIVTMNRLLLDGGISTVDVPPQTSHLHHTGRCGYGTYTTTEGLTVTASSGLAWAGYTPL